MFSILYYKGFSVVRTMNVLETCDLVSSWADKLEREMAASVKKSSVKMPYYVSAHAHLQLVSATADSTDSTDSTDSRENVQQFNIELNDNDGGEVRMGQPQSLQSQSQQSVGQPQPLQSYDYCSVLKVKKEKNANVTPENIGVIMLSTIPGISSKTAIVIMNEFKTIGQLIKSFELNPHCLNHVCIETNGKPRKIASTCIENVRKYLLNM
jgi:ERCC4-type nuclease